MTALDVEAAWLLCSAYAVNQETYGQLVSGVDRYGVPLIDMFLFSYDQMEQGYVTLDAEMTETIENLHTQLTDAQLQLKGENYSRLVLQLDLPEESEETFAFLDTLDRLIDRALDDAQSPAAASLAGQLPNIPPEFTAFTLTLIAEGETVTRIPFLYGEDLSRLTLPAVPEREDSYGSWPEFEPSGVNSDIVLEAVYTPWITLTAARNCPASCLWRKAVSLK